MARARSHHIGPSMPLARVPTTTIRASKPSRPPQHVRERRKGERRGHHRRGEMLEEEGIGEREDPRGRGSREPRHWAWGEEGGPSRRSMDGRRRMEFG